MKKIILIIITILWMIFIFSMSNKPAKESSEISNSFIKQTIVNVYKIFNKNTTLEEEIEIVNKLSHPIRKLAHFTIFLVLGLLVFKTLNSINPKYKKLFLASILICIIYACSDELHQLFIPGRSCELKDVIIDNTGSLIGIYLISLKNRRVL